MAYLERFISWRYLFSGHRRALVSVITLISISGVTIGVAALIIVFGVIEGMDREIFGKIVEIYPHVKVQSEGGRPLADPAPLLEKLRARREVDLAEPVIARDVILNVGLMPSAPKVPAKLIGVERLGRNQIFNIPNMETGGAISLRDKEILLGLPLAINLEAHPGATVYCTTGQLYRTPSGPRPKTRSLVVLGHYRTGVIDFDAVTSFVSVGSAREIFSLGAGADYIHVKLKNPYAAAAVKEEFGKLLGAGVELTTWEEENGEFFQALKLEKLGLFVILLLVVIVASFNIIGTLILMVIEKRPEIGILKAIGASDGMVRRTFLNAGCIIGVLGTTSGLALGLLGSWMVKNHLRLGSAGDLYNLDRLPVVLHPTTVGFIVACALGISLVAALFPSAQASKLDPVEALRHE